MNKLPLDDAAMTTGPRNSELGEAAATIDSDVVAHPPVDPPRSWWQFSLRTMFVLVTLLVIGLAWFVSGPETQRRAVAAIEDTGGFVVYWNERSVRESWLPRDYFERVRAVHLVSPQHAAQQIEATACLVSVEEVGICWGDVPVNGIDRLATVESVKCVSISDTLNNDFLLSHLKRLPRVEKLEICRGDLTDAGMTHLAEMKQLKELTLKRTRITDSGLRHLSNLEQLESLDLSENSITDEGIAGLGKCTKLERLQLTSTHIQGTGLSHLARPSALTILRLDYSFVDDSGLRYLQGFDSLERLVLDHTYVTDAGLDQLPWLPSLQSIETGCAAVTPLRLKRFHEEQHARRLAARKSDD